MRISVTLYFSMTLLLWDQMAAKTEASSSGSQGGSSSLPLIAESGGNALPPEVANNLPRAVCNAVDVDREFRRRGCDVETVRVKHCVGACLSLHITGSREPAVFCNQCKPTGFMNHTINFNCSGRSGSSRKNIRIPQGCSCQPC